MKGDRDLTQDLTQEMNIPKWKWREVRFVLGKGPYRQVLDQEDEKQRGKGLAV